MLPGFTHRSAAANATERRSKPNAGKVSFYKCRNLLNRTSLPTSLPRVVQTVLPSALREQPRYSNHSSGGDSRRRETQLLERSPAKLYVFSQMVILPC